MNISSVQASSMAHLGAQNRTTALATEATEQKATQTKDQIAIAVIKQVQDQQQVMVDGLQQMMESTLDIYA